MLQNDMVKFSFNQKEVYILGFWELKLAKIRNFDFILVAVPEWLSPADLKIFNTWVLSKSGKLMFHWVCI